MEKFGIKKWLILVLSLIGFATTVKLAMIYYDANFNPYALSSFCSINEFIDCDGIAKTTDSQFFGIPLAYWGMFLYLFIILLLFADKLKNIKFLKFLEVFKRPLDYIASLGFISFLISITLLCLSLFSIHKLCVLCAFTYILNLLIALIATDFKEYGNGGAFVIPIKHSVEDFLSAIKNKVYLVAFIVAALLATGVLVYTGTSYVFAPQVKRQRDIQEFAKAKTNKYAVKGNLLGEENAKVVINTYTDYRCPICYAHNIMMHKLAKELKGVKVVHHNLPLDMECNRYLVRPFHDGSCQMAKYAIAAEKQGKFWEINSKFFEKQPNTVDDIMQIAKEEGLDLERLEKDATGEQVAQELQDEIDTAFKRGINATPSTLVNGKLEVGIKPYDEFKKWLIDEGAQKR